MGERADIGKQLKTRPLTPEEIAAKPSPERVLEIVQEARRQMRTTIEQREKMFKDDPDALRIICRN